MSSFAPESVDMSMLIPRHIRTKVGEERMSFASMQKERKIEDEPEIPR